MAPKFTDQLSEALKSDTIVEVLMKALSPSILLSVQEMMQQELGQSLKDLAAENRALKVKVTQLQRDNEDLVKRIKSTDERVETIDRESRSKNIIINGLPNTSFVEAGSADGQDGDNITNMAVAKTVCKLFQDKLNVTVPLEDISSSFRMKKGPKDKERPIMVKFANSNTKESVMRAKKELGKNNIPIFISDHLTKAAAEIFAKARALVKGKKLHAAWSFSGLVYVKVNPTARATIIKSLNDLPVS